MSNTQKEMPEWFDGKKINEILFCEAFRKEHPMICIPCNRNQNIAVEFTAWI